VIKVSLYTGPKYKWQNREVVYFKITVNKKTCRKISK